MPAGRAAPVALALLWALQLAAAGSGPVAAEQPRLLLSANSPVFEGGEVELVVEMRGALADRLVTFTITVDGEAVDRFDVRGPSGRYRFRSPSLTAGVHEVGIRTGSEKARIDIRVLPRWTIVSSAAILAALTALLLLALRRRVRSRGGNG